MEKIIFIHLFNVRSGSPKVLSQVINSLRKKKFYTELLTSAHTDGFLTNIADQQHSLFYRRSENKLLTLFYYLLSQILLFIQCLRYWNKDVVFYINTMMPFGAALAGKLMGKQVYWHLHETSIKPKLLKQFLRFIINLTADKIIFVSRYLQEAESFKNKDQIIIYNSIDSTLIPEKKPKILPNTFNILMVCSLKKYKGVFEFLKIANLLHQNISLSFTLILNADQNEIDDYLNDETIPTNVTIYSRQQDVDLFYTQGNLLLNLSRPDEWIETFGLTILEGMIHGLPVIAPPVGGPAEIVRNTIEGYLISSYEVNTIAEKIVFLSTHKTEYETLSINALRRVNDFNEKEFEEKISAVFEGKK